jgi:hypothetical protein
MFYVSDSTRFSRDFIQSICDDYNASMPEFVHVPLYCPVIGWHVSLTVRKS